MSIPDFTHFTEEQLRQLLEAVQTELMERLLASRRECSVEQIYKRVLPQARKVYVYRVTAEERRMQHTARLEDMFGDEAGYKTKYVLLRVLERKETEPAFDSFVARVGEIIELNFVIHNNSGKNRYWYVVCDDGLLKHICWFPNTHRRTLAEAYLSGKLKLMTFLQKLDAPRSEMLDDCDLL
jgi:hypothetical protein